MAILKSVFEQFDKDWRKNMQQNLEEALLKGFIL